MTKLVGFYPGSFDPLTNGHLDVIERAFTGDRFSYEGRYYNVMDAQLRPTPVQRPIPICKGIKLLQIAHRMAGLVGDGLADLRSKLYEISEMSAGKALIAHYRQPRQSLPAPRVLA